MLRLIGYKIMGHVFISYSRKDKFYVKQMVNEFSRRGIESWLDERRIEVSDTWFQEITNAILSCSAFIVVMTPDSENSEWVNREILIALRAKISIFPVLLRGHEFYILGDIQFEDVRGGGLPSEDFYVRISTQTESVSQLQPVGFGIKNKVWLGAVALLLLYGLLIKTADFILGATDEVSFESDTGETSSISVFVIVIAFNLIVVYPLVLSVIAWFFPLHPFKTLAWVFALYLSFGLGQNIFLGASSDSVGNIACTCCCWGAILPTSVSWYKFFQYQFPGTYRRWLGGINV